MELGLTLSYPQSNITTFPAEQDIVDLLVGWFVDKNTATTVKSQIAGEDTVVDVNTI